MGETRSPWKGKSRGERSGPRALGEQAGPWGALAGCFSPSPVVTTAFWVSEAACTSSIRPLTTFTKASCSASVFLLS